MSDATRDPGLLLDLYLDGEMTDAERAEFERRLSEDAALRARVERERELEAGLRRAFAPPAGIGVMSDAASASPARRSRPPSAPRVPPAVRFAAAAVILLALGVAAYLVNRPAPMPKTDLAALYRTVVKGGFTPQFVCTTDAEFEKTIRDRFGEPMLVAASADVQLVGWAYGPNYNAITLSANTLVLLARAEGRETLVFIDRARDAGAPTFDASSGLRLFRGEVGGLVLYEVTPLERAVIIPRAYAPKG